MQGQGCNTYQVLDLTYMEAWLQGNHDKVMEYRRRIEDHKRECPICSNPAGLATQLWEGVKVAAEG